MLTTFVRILGFISIFVLIVSGAASTNAEKAVSSPFERINQWSAYASIAVDHVASEQEISTQQLSVLLDREQFSEILGKSYQAVVVYDRENSKPYKLVVDHLTKHVQSQAAIIAEESTAFKTEFGKFEPALYDWMQKALATDSITLAVIAAAKPGQSFAEMEKAAHDQLIAQYPASRLAYDNNRHPLDVSDPELGKLVYRDYVRIMQVQVEERVELLRRDLQSRRIPFTTVSGVPALIITATKAEVQELSNSPQVGYFMISSQERVQEAASALSGHLTASHIQDVWDLGYKGEDTSVAIVEFGTADFQSTWDVCPNGTYNCYLHPGMTRGSNTTEHAIAVASIIANNAPFPDDATETLGIAPETTIHSAAAFSPGDSVAVSDALDWTLATAEADVINTSLIENHSSDALQIFDWHYDWRARSYNRLLVNAAGNNDALVGSPARGWNVLTVGGYNQLNFTMWSNPSQGEGSAWQNPASGVEKPELVAPVMDIAVTAHVNPDGSMDYGEPTPGTSLAAPHVSAIAALLIDRNSELRNNPTALKAILMATATRNISGATGIFSSQDEHDGAGAVNALQAINAAGRRRSYTLACEDSCWIGEQLTSGDFNDGVRNYSFYAEAGDRMRFTTAWWGSAEFDGDWHHSLKTDLDIELRGPNGLWVSNESSSWSSSNVEMVPTDGYIIAPQTGYYTLSVYNYMFDEPSNQVSIAYSRIPKPSNTGTISGSTWYDYDEDGVFDTEEEEFSFHDGGPILLYEDTNDNGVFEPGTSDILVTSVYSTYPDGDFSFAGLAPGKYWVHSAFATTPSPIGPITLGGSGAVTGIDIGVNLSCYFCS